jgi:DNA-binding phage protein
MRVKSISYQGYLIESLKDSTEAVSYLNAVVEGGDVDVFLQALRNVAQAENNAMKLPSDS